MVANVPCIVPVSWQSFSFFYATSILITSQEDAKGSLLFCMIITLMGAGTVRGGGHVGGGRRRWVELLGGQIILYLELSYGYTHLQVLL